MSKPTFIHGITSLKEQFLPCVATIGSYDGVHRGHQAVLSQLKEKAAELNLPTMVMLFEPQPYEYFSKEQAPARLMRLREKVLALFDQGIDRVLCLKFDQALRSLTAQEFIEKVLMEAAGVRYLVIGDDFRFGCDRTGDFSLLTNQGKRLGFGVSDTFTEKSQNKRISSTRIRRELEKNQLQYATELLGKPYAIKGRVVYGKQIGRTMGFPTLNIGLGRYRSPVQGVFAVHVQLAGELELMPAVANVGVRPTVGGRKKPLLEVHVLDRDVQLYGCFVTVSFLTKIRNEQKFSSLDELKGQIGKDIDAARQIFQSHD